MQASRTNDMTLARSYWTRALELNPSHLNALLALSQDLLREQKAAQARPRLERAVEIEPSSWRAHMLLAQADLFQGKHDDAVKEAERALELDDQRAVSVQPLLAHALFESGDKDRAINILQDYVQGHPADVNAAKLLGRLKSVSNHDHCGRRFGCGGRRRGRANQRRRFGSSDELASA